MSTPTVTYLVPSKPHLGARVCSDSVAFEIAPELSASGKKAVINRYTLNLVSLRPVLVEDLPVVEAAMSRAKKHMLELTVKHVGKSRFT